MKGLWISTFMLYIFYSCSQPENHSDPSTSESETHFASGFELYEDSISVLEPWPGAVKSITYKFNEAPKRIVVTSTTHLPYLELLGVETTLVGFPSTQYISSDNIRKLVEQGNIKDLGPDGNMNLEILFDLKPDLVIAFDMGKESTTLDKIEEAGIDVVYNSDYLEKTALGRAEWIKFFGAIFQKRDKADSIFQEIAREYNQLKEIADTISNKPSVFSGVMYGDAWFLPGGENWSAQFFTDAGANYIWEENTSSGWLELSFESVYAKANQAEYWIGVSTFTSLSELQGQDVRYSDFSAFKNNKVYNYSKKTSESGGFDFFESGYSRPDVILADLIHIFHPHLLPEHNLNYFEKLK